MLARFALLGFDVGVTPRGLIDGLIASVARRLLAADTGISRGARVVGIDLDAAS
jgi:hypothetical protein